MLRFFTISVCLIGGLLAARPVLAQAPLLRPLATESFGAAALDGGQRCAQGHVNAAQRQVNTTLRHRQKMDRYDVKYYKLDLALENTSLNVAGMCWMRVRVGAQPLDSLAFELYQAPAGSSAGTATMLIDSVVFDRRRSPGVRRQGNDATAALAVPAAAGALLDARIYYRGTAPSGQSAAIGNALSQASSVRVNGTTYPYNIVWSLSEPFSAHEWFPCKQVLTDKADSSDVWVTTTLPNKVGSNGVLQRTVPLPNNKVRYEWKSRNPIDYYLISVAVAPYVEYVNYANPAGGPRIPIVNYVYNAPTLTYYQTEIDRTPGFIENYSSLVGLYPFANEKYGHSMAPLGGGMEHQTMTTQDGFEFTLTAHELFHQWFGDNVTCASWEDIWLNESFASYGEYLSLSALSTPTNARNWMDAAHLYSMFYYPGGGAMPGGSVRVPDTTNVNRIFNYNLTYKKGATVVHMLRYLLNDDTKFFRALRTYQSTYGGRTARTADLQRIFEVEAGRPLGYFFQQWYAGQGYPTFNVRWNQVGNTVVLQSSETTSMPTVTPFFATDVDYRLSFSDGTSRIVRLNQGQPVSGYNVPVGNVTLTQVEVDPNQWILNGTGTVARDNQLQLLSTRGATLPGITLYPNPCREQLNLVDLPAARTTALVLDATGRVVLRRALAPGSTTLDTHSLAPGLYQLRLTDEQGLALSQGRFVRE